MNGEDAGYAEIMPKTKLKGHSSHWFKFEPPIAVSKNQLIRFKSYPDGGVSRLWLYGTNGSDKIFEAACRDPADPKAKELVKVRPQLFPGNTLECLKKWSEQLDGFNPEDPNPIQVEPHPIVVRYPFRIGNQQRPHQQKDEEDETRDINTLKSAK